jgi:hypothetical protein
MQRRDVTTDEVAAVHEAAMAEGIVERVGSAAAA